MGKVVNICLLDARKATEKSLSNITELENIGSLIYSDTTASLISSIKKINIGSMVKIDENESIDYMTENGKAVIDEALLEEVDNKLFVLVNGVCEIKEMPKELFKEKIHSMTVNGLVICPESLKSVVSIKSKINGLTIALKEGYRFIDDTVLLNETFIVKQVNAKLTIEKLVAIDKIDEDSFNESIEHIQILDELVITKGNLRILRKTIDNLEEVELTIVPDNSVFKEGTVEINSATIKFYDGESLVVDGKLVIKDVAPEELRKHITSIYSDKVFCDEELSQTVKELCNNSNVRIMNNNDIHNNGKLVIDKNYLLGLEGKVAIDNNGKLVIDESVTLETAKDKIKSITNKGLLKADTSVLSGIPIINHGKLSPINNTDKKQENNIIYENMLVLEL
ncbi:hypothetical protein [Vallitalea guaymasensis]|uniref:Uncharacterized protein n=1 Tax=Vallitalea guaymasensis TaxID=1185412 RepID=A0A8J8SCZ8_9FIRM|nr:hypothetical protein [Vallitalea guaymasensis]QUH30292.1 hypothetical protein HYG85_15845 [Vallitalea guaymasensis]